MTIMYSVPVKVLDKSAELEIQGSLRGYRIFTDKSGNLDGTGFFKETLPYVGELIVVKTLKREAAQTAHDILSGIEGLLVLPINASNLEEDIERFNTLRKSTPS